MGFSGQTQNARVQELKDSVFLILTKFLDIPTFDLKALTKICTNCIRGTYNSHKGAALRWYGKPPFFLNTVFSYIKSRTHTDLQDQN